MRISSSFPRILLCSILLVVTGCTESSNPVDALVDTPEASSRHVDIPHLEGTATAKAEWQSPDLSKSSGDAVYTFDDLPRLCVWDWEFPETYHDLTFSGSRYLATCEMNGEIGIVPVNLDRQNDQTETSIRLPRPATEVSISFFGMRFHHRARIFVAYNEAGVEIDRASRPSDGSWSRLTVTGTIHEVAIIDYQSQTMWDDLTVIFGASNEAPTADAGSSQTVIVSESVPLDGSQSTDPEGDGLTYLWDWAERPAASLAEISEPTAAVTAFTADKPGTYSVELVVNDGSLDSDPDLVEILALSAGEAVSKLQGTISDLHAERILTSGQANSLRRMLESVAAKADRQPHVAIRKLDAFAAHVSGLIRGGRLSPEKGEELVGYSDRIASALRHHSDPS